MDLESRSILQNTFFFQGQNLPAERKIISALLLDFFFFLEMFPKLIKFTGKKPSTVIVLEKLILVQS